MPAIARSFLTLVGVLVVYLAIPTRDLSASRETALSLVALGGGSAVVAALTLRNVRRRLAGDEAVRRRAAAHR